MPTIGRPRLTEDDLQARTAAYCARYRVAPGSTGLPPFPSGQRETPQHREWMGLYKLHQRLGRRRRSQCERCHEPVSPGSVFCSTHRSAGAGLAPEERQRLLAAQSGRCPVCLGPVEAEGPVHRDPATGTARALMDERCARLAGLAEALGVDSLDRLGRYLHGPRARAGRKP